MPPSEGGDGLIIHDQRPDGFYARITAHATGNAYGFARVDDGDHEEFGELEGAYQFGTGDAEKSAVAYEVNGRDDVPADGSAVVWLEPLQAGVPGYGFEYATPDSTCSGLGWLAALRRTDCLRISVEGDGGVTPVTLTSDDGVTWTSTDAITICGSEFVPVVEIDEDSAADPTFVLRFVGRADSEDEVTPFSVRGRIDCAGCAYAVFAFAKRKLCPCGTLTGDPCADLVRVRVAADAGCAGEGRAAACGYPEGLPRSFARFTGDLAWLGCREWLPTSVDGVLEAAGPWPATRSTVYVDDFGDEFPATESVTGATLTIGEVDGVCQAAVRLVGYLTVGGGDTSGGSGSFTLLTAEFFFDSTDPAAFAFDQDFADTDGAAGVETSQTGCGASSSDLPAGYTEPGWYVVSGSAVPVWIDDATRCYPWTILCGPYDTEADAQTALESGCADDCASITGWAGPGWYCILVGGVCTAAELLDEDRCDAAVHVCSGPYPDEASATASCGSSGSGPGNEHGHCSTYSASGYVLSNAGGTAYWQQTGGGTPTLFLHYPNTLSGGTANGDYWQLNDTSANVYTYPSSWDGQGCVTFVKVTGPGPDTVEVCCGGGGSGGGQYLACCPGMGLLTGGTMNAPPNACGIPSGNVELTTYSRGTNSSIGSWTQIVGETVTAFGFIECTPLDPVNGWWSQIVLWDEANDTSYPTISGELVSATCGVGTVTVVMRYTINAPCYLVIDITYTLVSA